MNLNTLTGHLLGTRVQLLIKTSNEPVAWQKSMAILWVKTLMGATLMTENTGAFELIGRQQELK